MAATAFGLFRLEIIADDVASLADYLDIKMMR